MKKNVNKQLIIWKKKIQEKPETYTYSEKTGSGHIYITLYYGNVQKKFSFLLSDLRKK